MAKHGVFESINMKSTKYAERIYDAVAEIEIENGMVGTLGGLADGYDTIYEFTPGVTAGKTIVIVDQPAWDYNEFSRANQRRDKFVVPAGIKFRVRVLALNDEFGINDTCVTSASQTLLKKGAFLTVDTSGKLVAKAATTADAILEAVVLRERISGNTVVTKGDSTYGYSDKIYECVIKTISLTPKASS